MLCQDFMKALMFHKLFTKNVILWQWCYSNQKRKQKGKSYSSNQSQKTSMFTRINAVSYYVFKMFTDRNILLTEMSVKISMKKTMEQSQVYILNVLCNLQQIQIYGLHKTHAKHLLHTHWSKTFQEQKFRKLLHTD